ncbi:orotate phosphoribosyltransferase [Phaeovibrio sulfidiphilus]|uniref:Orotate phosphoribosyltransferase n=1 Tax=Phaeovibrio sulfidiphilus TaxID=1220600 RepID=A0A8J6YY55_9PROT|nr:orotate phosphoribosyltransferase [Phaeovibrio sulfidiphilus]MBE1237842.1 orotate phosphoribosyltransferase [Phaeovibrio sulfidiphilus]
MSSQSFSSPRASRTPADAEAARVVARLLLEIEAVNFRPEEPYILTAGWASPVYIDCRKIIGFPRARRKIMSLARDHIERTVGSESLDLVAGGETAGIPFAAWIAEGLALPMSYVRKKPKGFGRMARIEGILREGDRTLLVEDLTSDGGSKIIFADALRSAGAIVDHAFVVFYYAAFPGALETLAEHGIQLHWLATWNDVLEVAQERQAFSPEAIEEVRAFLADPTGWSAAHGGKGA